MNDRILQTTEDLQLLSSSEVSRLIGLSQRQMKRLIEKGAIPSPLIIGSSRRWRKIDIQQWLKNGCKPE